MSHTQTPTDHTTQHSVPLELVPRPVWQAALADFHGIDGAEGSNFQEPLTFLNEPDTKLAYYSLSDAIARRKGSAEYDNLAEHIKRLKDTSEEEVAYAALAELVMGDETVREFLQQKNSGPDSSKGLQELYPRFTKMYKEGVKEGIRQGCIPSYVKQRLNPAFKSTAIRIKDRTYLEFAYGRYAAADDTLTIDEDEVGDMLTLTHEMTHKVSGGTFAAGSFPGYAGNHTRLRHGFANYGKQGDDIVKVEGSKASLAEGSALDEIVTQVVTYGIMDGDFETIDPDKRSEPIDSYYDFLKLGAVFVGRSQGIITSRMLTNAYFEDSGPHESSINRRKLIRGIRTAYGPGARRKLEVLCSAATERGIGSLISRIIGPELGKNGRVVKEGFIDIEGLQRYTSGTIHSVEGDW